jgi:membrane protein insertase Oxa1/YidC/SpoIIIJ
LVFAVIFLVVTLRAVLVMPFLKQARFQQVMSRLRRQIEAIQKRYAGDRRRQSVEIQKLQHDYGVNLLLAACRRLRSRCCSSVCFMSCDLSTALERHCTPRR